MNGRTILIGTCVVGSLVGLGFLTHYVYGGSKVNTEPELEEDNISSPSGNRNRKPENSYSRPAKKHSVRKNRNQSKNKVERQKEMVHSKAKQPPIADEFPLRFGSKGDRVERLQVWLMRNYGWTGKITREFDEKTLALVKRFLKSDELDEATYNKMRMGKPVYEQTLMR